MTPNTDRTTNDRDRWDEKYRGAFGRKVTVADPFVCAALPRIEAALAGLGSPRALDLACGTGRHALLLAERGFRTSGWDVSPVALELLGERARRAGVRIETQVVDLLAPLKKRGQPGEWPDAWPFELVTIVDFLDRGLWARLGELVRPGGHLLAVTFTVDQRGAKPPLKYRLRRGELADGVPGFETLEVRESDGRAGLWARREAGDDPSDLRATSVDD